MGKLFELWKRWCDTTTFHGFNELEYLEKLSFKSAIWFLLITSATVGTAFEISRVFEDFRENPTAVQVEEIPLASLKLPDLIFCSGKRLDTKKLRHYGVTSELIDGIMLNPSNPVFMITNYSTNLSNFTRKWSKIYAETAARLNIPDANAFLKEFAIPCEDFMVSCSTFLGPFDCCKNAELVLDYTFFSCYRVSNLGNQTWPGNQAGVTVALRNHGTSEEDETIADMLEGGALQIAHPGMPYNFEKFIFPGSSMISVTFHLQKTSYLSTFKRKCQPLKPNATIFEATQTGCIWGHFFKIYLEICKCWPWVFTNPLPNIPYCDPFQYQECFTFNKTNFAKIYNYTMVNSEDCATPFCDSWTYNPTLTSQQINTKVQKKYLQNPDQHSNDSFMILQIYFPKLSLTAMTEVEVYTVDTFISNVGGQLGLWLGVSALTVTQALTYILECLFVAKRRMLTAQMKAPKQSRTESFYVGTK